MTGQKNCCGAINQSGLYYRALKNWRVVSSVYRVWTETKKERRKAKTKKTDEHKKSGKGQKVHERQSGRYQLSMMGKIYGRF